MKINLANCRPELKARIEEQMRRDDANKPKDGSIPVESIYANNTPTLPARQPKRPKGGALGRRVSRKETGGTRLEIRFTVHAMRPCDWDGWHIKPLQDMLIAAGILPGDEWNILSGSVCSRQVHSKEEERTEIEIV